MFTCLYCGKKVSPWDVQETTAKKDEVPNLTREPLVTYVDDGEDKY